MAVHIEETMRYDPDGYWFDGDWGGAVCYCPRCRELFARWYGKPVKKLPRIKHSLSDTDTALGKAWHAWTLEMNNEWRRKVAALIHRLKPACLYSAGNVAFRPDLPSYMDFNSGDWFSPNNHRLAQSVWMRYFTTLGLPYEAMTCDTQYCVGLKKLRSRLKTADRMMQEGATLLANGGQWLYWTYPMPNGALIPSRVRQAKACREFYEKRRKLFHGTESAKWCAVVMAGIHVYRPWLDEGPGPAARAFIQLHRSPDVVDAPRITEDSPYEILAVASQPDIEPATMKVLESLVRKGGILISSGSTIRSAGMQKLLGVKLVRENVLNEGHVILADKTPVGVYTPWDQVKPISAKEWYPLYKSWDHDNPRLKEVLKDFHIAYPITGMLDEEKPERVGFPAVTARRVGKGLALHIACDPFTSLLKFGYPQIRRWLQEIMARFQPRPWFSTDAPSWVEVTLRRRQDELLIHFINGNSGRDLSLVKSQDLFVDEIPEIGPINVRLACAKQPRRVTLEPEGCKPEIAWRNNVLQIVIPRVHIHACLVIQR